MVDITLKELQTHGQPFLPIATYDWYGSAENNMLLECHWHDEWEFFTVTSGSVLFSLNGNTARINAGDMALIPGGQLHMCDTADGQPYRYRAIVFNPNIILSLPNDIVGSKYIMPLLDGSLYARSFFTDAPPDNTSLTAFSKLFYCVENKPPLYEMLCKAYLLELIADWISKDISDQPRSYNERSDFSANMMKRVIAYIDSNYNKHISVAQLAKTATMSVGHFTRVFHRFTSKSPLEYVIIIRLLRASEMLLATDKTLLDISLDTGFNSLSYFSRAFKSHFSCSPLDFRKSRGQIKSA